MVVGAPADLDPAQAAQVPVGQRGGVVPDRVPCRTHRVPQDEDRRIGAEAYGYSAERSHQ
jgi:hypothetical protein